MRRYLKSPYVEFGVSGIRPDLVYPFYIFTQNKLGYFIRIAVPILPVYHQMYFPYDVMRPAQQRLVLYRSQLVKMLSYRIICISIFHLGHTKGDNNYNWNGTNPGIFRDIRSISVLPLLHISSN